MNEILDLEDLMYENRRRERARIEVFQEILTNCHSKITRYNREHKVKNCFISVPVFIPGKPPYDYEVLINYLLYHLKDNGLHVRYLPHKKQLYISWDEKHIDLKRYEGRKQRINKEKYSDAYNAREINSSRYGSGSMFQAPRKHTITVSSNSKSRKKLADMGNSNVINDFFGPINKAKHQNAQRIQQQREHDFRNHVQNQNVPKKSFDDFFKSCM